MRAAPLAVVVYPNAAVGVMAGAASMPPLHFVALTLLSIGVRAYAARQAGWCAHTLTHPQRYPQGGTRSSFTQTGNSRELRWGGQ